MQAHGRHAAKQDNSLVMAGHSRSKNGVDFARP